jgi:hypothetical protein
MMPSGSSAAGLGWPTSQVGWSSRAMGRLPASMRAAASLTSMRRWSRPRRWSVAPLVFLHRLGATARQARLDGVRGSDLVAAQKLKACPQALQTASDKRSPSLPLAGPSLPWSSSGGVAAGDQHPGQRRVIRPPPGRLRTDRAGPAQLPPHRLGRADCSGPPSPAAGTDVDPASSRSHRASQPVHQPPEHQDPLGGLGVGEGGGGRGRRGRPPARLNARLSPPWGLAPAPHGRHHPAGPGPRPGHAGRP